MIWEILYRLQKYSLLAVYRYQFLLNKNMVISELEQQLLQLSPNDKLYDSTIFTTTTIRTQGYHL